MATADSSSLKFGEALIALTLLGLALVGIIFLGFVLTGHTQDAIDLAPNLVAKLFSGGWGVAKIVLFVVVGIPLILLTFPISFPVLLIVLLWKLISGS